MAATEEMVGEMSMPSPFIQADSALQAADTAGAPTSLRQPATALAQIAEFLFVGGLTPLCFLASWLLRKQLALSEAELAVGFTFFHLAFVVNDPHFAVTYVLFYRDFRQRAVGRAFPLALRWRYWLAGVAVPMGLIAWSGYALLSRSAETLGVLFQLMLFLVGWHYVKQGFGVMLVLARRRGVVFEKRERLVVLCHCYVAWLFSWANPHQDVHREWIKGVGYTALARPRWLEAGMLGLLVISSLCLAFMLFFKWRREGKLPLVTPLVALLCSLWTWLIFSAADPLVRYMTPALHSLQYLYFVWLLRRNEAKSREGAPHFEVPRERVAAMALAALLLGWLLFHGLPSALDDMFRPRLGLPADTALGPTPFFAALFAIVNVHHYFMDNVIWRRENPATRLLYRW